MMSLTYLDAAGNGLEVLAPELSRCTALEHLDISGGEVDTLSEGLSRLTKLRWTGDARVAFARCCTTIAVACIAFVPAVYRLTPAV